MQQLLNWMKVYLQAEKTGKLFSPAYFFLIQTAYILRQEISKETDKQEPVFRLSSTADSVELYTLTVLSPCCAYSQAVKLFRAECSLETKTRIFIKRLRSEVTVTFQ